MKKNILLFFTLIISLKSFGFGSEGHQIVGGVAAHILDKNVKDNVQKYLGTMTFEEASVWMDQMRSNHDYDFMRTWHYIDFEKGQDYKPTNDENIVNTLISATNELKHKQTLCDAQIKNDILLLFHLIGDLHQPLHTGYATDKGGNDIKVNFMSTSTNLHHIWDSDIIEKENITKDECLKLYGDMTVNEMTKVKTIDILAWMSESRSYLDTVYNFTGKDIDEAYAAKNKLLLEKRLVYAGVRLAAVLEKYFGTISPAPVTASIASIPVAANPKQTVATADNKSISAADANKHVGETITVSGRVYGTKYLEQKSGVTFINMGAAYPNSPFTAVIFKGDRGNFSYKPEDALDGKTIYVTGVVKEYQGKAEIIVNREEQIRISQ